MKYKVYITKFYVSGGWETQEDFMTSLQIKEFVNHWNTHTEPTKVNNGLTWVLNRDPKHGKYITIDIAILDSKGDRLDIERII